MFGHLVPDTDTVASALVYAWELGMRNLSATAYRLGDLNSETTFVLNALGVESPPLLLKLESKQEIAVVDTNNPEELLQGISSTRLLSIVDHHKLSGLTNAEPLEVDMRPLCSATSILYSRSKAAGFAIPKQIAGLMLAGILSDSLEFRSPTTTDLDRVHATELSVLAGLDVKYFASAMLEAKANVDHLTAEQLIMLDTKVFKIGGKRLRVSVLETTKPAVPLARLSDLIATQRTLASKEGLDDVLFFVVDILKEAATFVSSSDSATSIVQKAWKVEVGDDGTVLLPGVLSRKKQIIPALEAASASDEL